MYSASINGRLSTKDFSKWLGKNIMKYNKFLYKIESEEINKLKQNGYIYERKNKEECNHKFVLSDKIYNDSVKLYGLKLYLKNYCAIHNRDMVEVKLWNEYLMFAYLFGIADSVSKEMKNIIPEDIEIDMSLDDVVSCIDIVSTAFNSLISDRKNK